MNPVSLEFNSYMSHEQRTEIMALLVALPVGCTHSAQSVSPSGQFSFSVTGPKPIMGDLQKQIVDIIGLPEPGLRSYTLQEAYNLFGYRTYTNIRYKGVPDLHFNDSEGFSHLAASNECIIYGMSIASGVVFAKIQPTMDSAFCLYVTLEALVRDWEWMDGKPCGYQVPSKSIQRREAVQGRSRLGYD